MPSYNLVCPKDGHRSKRIFPKPMKKWTEQEQLSVFRARLLFCPQCGGKMSVEDPTPTATVKETLDNGYMTRKLERPADAERLYRERAANDPRNKR